MVVVDAGEFVELGLPFGEGGGWVLGSQPSFEGLLEPFDAPMFVKCCVVGLVVLGGR